MKLPAKSRLIAKKVAHAKAGDGACMPCGVRMDGECDVELSGACVGDFAPSDIGMEFMGMGKKGDDDDASDEELHFEELDSESMEKEVEKEAESVAPASVPGRRLGICGYDEAAVTARTKCLVCLDKGFPQSVATFTAKTPRFFYRWKGNKPDRSVHLACVLSGAILDIPSGSKTHWEDSVSWLTNAAMSGSDEARTVRLLEAADVFRVRLSEPSSSSGSGVGSAAAAGSKGG